MTGSDAAGNGSAKSVRIPKTMVEALEFDDPCEALLALSLHSQKKASDLSRKLLSDIRESSSSSNNNNNNNNDDDDDEDSHNRLADVLPDLLKRLPNTQDADSHPVATAIACSDSILQSLTKIASGGSRASQEIIGLEQEKRELEQTAADIETALILRKASDAAARSLSAQRYEPASAAIHDYTQLQAKRKLTKRAVAYAGEYTVAQLESSKKALRTTLLGDYQEAVQASDLRTLGMLTPMLQMVECEKEAVALYLRFLKGILTTELDKAASNEHSSNSSSNNYNKQQKQKQQRPPSGPPPPYVPMGRVYNTAFTILRHHLPMVSHCLHRADGDAAVVQLVNVRIEETVLPLFDAYVSGKQLGRSARNALRIYGALEALLISESSFASEEAPDDAGFSTEIGSLADVDASMEEAVLCLQHAESYMRFLLHTCGEVNKARELRFRSEQEERRVERERREWTTGMKTKESSNETKNDDDNGNGNDNDGRNDNNDNDIDDDDSEREYVPLEILPTHTKLQEKLAEVGGYYASIESCLLLASMQRAFSISPEDARQYSALGGKAASAFASSGRPVPPATMKGPLKTSIVESSLYAARRGAQRAFATGHTGTAAAVTNYVSGCLRDVLAQYLIRRAEELGVNPLKPGEGLLEGSAGIFGTVGGALASRQAHGSAVDETQHKHEIETGISRACATLNDLEVASHHTQELERLLIKSVDTGFVAGTPETEQLRTCVRSLGPVAETFALASDQTVESLLSVLKSRIRAIVTDAVGSDHGSTHAQAGGFSLKVAATSSDRFHHHSVRMNYELDEDAYQLLEVSQSYVSRLCTLLDELLLPLCKYLAPRLADGLVLGVLGTVSKRLEVSLKKCRFTALGALSLDSDMRDLIHYAKDRLVSSEYNVSNVALCNACTPLSRLLQIAKLMNLDDLEDVLDLIASSKRKGNWDLKPEDARAYLSLRVEFDTEVVGQLLQAVVDED